MAKIRKGSIFKSFMVFQHLLCHLAVISVCLIFSACSTIRSSKPPEDAAAIRARLEQWKQDFNAGRQKEVCAIFAPDLRADTPQAVGRTREDLCQPLRRVMEDSNYAHSYAVEIYEIIVSGDYAVVRLAWTLTKKNRKSGLVTTSVEQGMDIFRRDPQGWRICRFMVFDR